MTGDEIQRVASAIATKLPKAELSYPFGDGIPVFKVMDKMFMLSSEIHGKKFINLKCEPQHAEMLRDIYDSIHTGYHMDKRHWISIYDGDQINQELLTDLVQSSYELVTQKLTKAQKNILKMHTALD
ncbi:MmcQ/YjbR family DNA-binding protein [Acinetobacter sp. ANC 4648]|uniref:MmcQ/YjbR family DNA-binding protein n=1 Tax=Acinetobacter sp. ANC 4648 TaxID=1977875 RepID=UPI000A332B56|nr:MmcQ/YjbR family DNA-binding protein [Acinetobacter sp. ANC 4648]OTG84701.1 hypothetical protein B9T27_00285 [Acinetobacter sp. ANC 4648]